jgi:hypothetical protein
MLTKRYRTSFAPAATANFISRRAILAIALLSGAAAANATSTYQITITPQLDPGFYGSESLVDFVSNEFNSDLPPYPPQWGEIQLTFTSTPAAMIANLGSVAESSQNLTMEMPQLNDYGPVPIGDNLVACDDPASQTCWSGYVIYVSTLEYPSLTQDELYAQIEDGLNQEWEIYVYFPAGATGIGNATSVSVTYSDPYNFGTHAQGFTYYCDPAYSGCSANGAQLTAPEPASLWFALAGLACLAVSRKNTFAAKQLPSRRNHC